MDSTELKRFFPSQQFGDVREIVPVPAGLSGSSTYSVVTAKGSFILRLHRGDRQRFENAAIFQSLAADAGVAPPLVMLDKKAQVSISLQIEGVPFAFAFAAPTMRDAAFASLTQQLRTLHAIAVPGLPVSNPIEFANKLWNEQIRRAGLPAWVSTLSDRLQNAAVRLTQDKRLVFSHCDLNPGNLIWDGNKAWILDWEAAGLSHPYLDLSILANFLSLSDAEAEVLLAKQEQRALSVHDRETFGVMRDLTRIIFGLYFLRLVPDLTAVSMASLEDTLSLKTCFGKLAAGSLKLNEADGQARIGAALLAQVLVGADYCR